MLSNQLANVNWPCQLPTYDGTKSYQNLLVEVYGGRNTNWTDFSRIGTISQQSPINFIRIGWVAYDSGKKGAATESGIYFGGSTANNINVNSLLIDSSHLVPTYNAGNGNYKGNGLALRCLVR